MGSSLEIDDILSSVVLDRLGSGKESCRKPQQFLSVWNI